MRKKVYGQSQTQACVFCGEAAYHENQQNVPVCRHHKRHELPGLKCVCGEWLDIKKGKYGAFYLCMECGPVNQRKMLEINAERIRDAKDEKKTSNPGPEKKESGQMALDRIREKVRKGIPLTLDELELL